MRKETDDYLTISRKSRITGKKYFMQKKFRDGIIFREFRYLGPLMPKHIYDGVDVHDVLAGHGYYVSWIRRCLYEYKFEMAYTNDLQHQLNDLSDI